MWLNSKYLESSGKGFTDMADIAICMQRVTGVLPVLVLFILKEVCCYNLRQMKSLLRYLQCFHIHVYICTYTNTDTKNDHFILLACAAGNKI